jgi:hypothetical protein
VLAGELLRRGHRQAPRSYRSDRGACVCAVPYGSARARAIGLGSLRHSRLNVPRSGGLRVDGRPGPTPRGVSLPVVTGVKQPSLCRRLGQVLSVTNQPVANTVPRSSRTSIVNDHVED